MPGWIWYHWDHGDKVAWLQWLEHCNKKDLGKAGRDMRRVCSPLRQWSAGEYGTLPGEGQKANQEFAGQTWGYLLEGQHGRTWAISKVPWMCQWQLPYTSDWGAKRWCHAGPSPHLQGAADGECSAPRQPWLQWPRDGGVWGPQDSEQAVSSLPWTSSPGEQTSASTQTYSVNPIGQSPGGPRGPRMLADIEGSPPLTSGMIHPDKENIWQNLHGWIRSCWAISDQKKKEAFRR